MSVYFLIYGKTYFHNNPPQASWLWTGALEARDSRSPRLMKFLHLIQDSATSKKIKKTLIKLN